MLTENSKIVAIDQDALWVETIQKSTCGTCVAQKGCGQTLLHQIGVKPVYLRVLLEGRPPEDYRINQTIEIGIPEDLVVTGSIVAYFLPVVLALVFAGVAHTYWAVEWLSMVSAAVGLVLGCVLIRWYSGRSHNNPRYQAVIIDGSPLIHKGK